MAAVIARPGLPEVRKSDFPHFGQVSAFTLFRIRAYSVRAYSCPPGESEMTKPEIKETESDVEEFADELSDEALDREEDTRFSKCPLSSWHRCRADT